MKKYIVLIAVLSIVIFPAMSWAQNVTPSQTVNSVQNSFQPLTSNSGTIGGGSATSSRSCSFNTLPTNSKLGDLLNYVTCMIGNSVIPLIFALALVSFIWGVVQYVINTSDETKKAKGKQFMIWGIVALAVMVSVWGLVHIIGNTFNIDYAIPQANTK